VLIQIFRKRLLLAFSSFFFTVLTSCSPPCYQWEIQKASSCDPSYKLAKMWMVPENNYNNLELEIDRSGSDIRMYINVYSLPVSSNSDEPFSVELSVAMDDEVRIAYGELLRGGQRILLEPEITGKIISALQISQRVTISVGRYRSEITTTNFNKCFSELYCN
jgi:hypothetical protein